MAPKTKERDLESLLYARFQRLFWENVVFRTSYVPARRYRGHKMKDHPMMELY